MAQSHNSKAQNFGANTAKAWLWVKRKESAFVDYLSGKGFPAALSKFFVLLVNLLVAAALLYTAFWFVLFVGVASFFIMVFKHVDVSEMGKAEEQNTDGFQWRNGNEGFGLYTSHGNRIDVDLDET